MDFVDSIDIIDTPTSTPEVSTPAVDKSSTTVNDIKGFISNLQSQGIKINISESDLGNKYQIIFQYERKPITLLISRSFCVQAQSDVRLCMCRDINRPSLFVTKKKPIFEKYCPAHF